MLGALLVGVQVIPPLQQVAHAAATYTYVVNDVGDGADAGTNGACLTAANTCTLRAAIQEAKARTSGTVAIQFSIPGPGPHVITPATSLPTLSNMNVPVTIDGYTQPGATPNTDQYASNAHIDIEIRGTGDKTTSFTLLYITSPNNVVRGLSLYNALKKIQLNGSNSYNNTLSGLFVGTDSTGTYTGSPRKLSINGIEVIYGAHDNIIGGPALADRNVLSGNAGHGIAFYSAGSDRNVVTNSIAGLSPDGLRSVPNLGQGIDIDRDTEYTRIGGFGPNDHNVVSGNGQGGIEVSHSPGTQDNQILGNWVGTTVDGNSSAPYTANQQTGIMVQDGSSLTLVAGNVVGNNGAAGITVETDGVGREAYDNTIIGNWIGVSRNGTPIPNTVGIEFHDNTYDNVVQENVITNNIGSGIVFTSPLPTAIGNTFTRNSIYANGGPGIDLPPTGAVNLNDAGDGDTGPNTLLNFPVITAASTASASGTVCAGCVVELFVADGAVGAYGSGKTYVGSATANGAGTWSLATGGLLTGGQVVTATATDAAGSTSEFAKNVAVTDSLLAGDLFERTVGSGWGTTDSGGTYGYKPGEQPSLSVAGGVGKMLVPAPGTSRRTWLPSLSVRDVDAVVSVSADKVATGGFGLTESLQLRRVTTNLSYNARLR